MARTTSDSENTPTPSSKDTPNPVWFKPVMFGFMLVGLVWILVYYVSQSSWPVPSIGPCAPPERGRNYTSVIIPSVESVVDNFPSRRAGSLRRGRIAALSR